MHVHARPGEDRSVRGLEGSGRARKGEGSESKIKGNARFSRKPLSAHRDLWRLPPLGWRQSTLCPRRACQKRRKSALFAVFSRDRHGAPACLRGGCSRRIEPTSILDIPHASVMPSDAPCTNGARGGPRFPSVHRRGPVRGEAGSAAWRHFRTPAPDQKDRPCLHCPRTLRSPSASPRPAG